MASAEVSGFRRRKVAPGLAGILVATIGLLTALLFLMSAPVARADSPQITLSTSTTNPGDDVNITGTGWAPAKHFNLYIYAQRACNGQPVCAPPAGQKPVNTNPVPITSSGKLSFTLTITTKAAAIIYVITVVADYPTDMPYMASVPLQVVPAGTPPSGTPVSSSPSASPTVAATNTPAVTASTAANPGGGNGNNQNNNQQQSNGSGSGLLIGVVGVLLFLMIGVLIALLIILPPKRRAIRAAYYGAEGGSRRDYAAQGARSRRTTGGYHPVDPEMPWQGGVAQWDDPPRGGRSSGPSGRDRYSQRPPPRRPTDREY